MMRSNPRSESDNDSGPDTISHHSEHESDEDHGPYEIKCNLWFQASSSTRISSLDAIVPVVVSYCNNRQATPEGFASAVQKAADTVQHVLSLEKSSFETSICSDITSGFAEEARRCYEKRNNLWLAMSSRWHVTRDYTFGKKLRVSVVAVLRPCWAQPVRLKFKSANGRAKFAAACGGLSIEDLKTQLAAVVQQESATIPVKQEPPPAVPRRIIKRESFIQKRPRPSPSTKMKAEVPGPKGKVEGSLSPLSKCFVPVQASRTTRKRTRQSKPITDGKDQPSRKRQRRPIKRSSTVDIAQAEGPRTYADIQDISEDDKPLAEVCVKRSSIVDIAQAERPKTYTDIQDISDDDKPLAEVCARTNTVASSIDDLCNTANDCAMLSIDEPSESTNSNVEKQHLEKQQHWLVQQTAALQISAGIVVAGIAFAGLSMGASSMAAGWLASHLA